MKITIYGWSTKGIEARSARRHADLLRRCLDFPIYGLPQTSPVERSVKVWETLDSERVWRVNLRHEFSSGDYIGVFCELAQEEDDYPSTTGFSYKDLGRIMAQKLAQVDVTISVDGTGIPFQAGPRDLDRPDRGWQANGAVGSVEVQINAVGPPIQDVKLVTILDVEPYFEGTAREQERLEALRRTIRERRKSRLLDP